MAYSGEPRWFHPLQRQTGPACSFCVTPRGLLVNYAGRRVEVIPWDAICAVERGSQRAVVRSSRGNVDLGPNLANWALAADLVEQALEPAADGAGPLLKPWCHTVSPELDRAQICAWLGIAEDGVLVCGPRPWARWLAVLVMLGLLLAPWPARSNLLFMLAFQLGLPLAGILLLSARVVRADGDGLLVRLRGRGRLVPWAEVDWAVGTLHTVVIGTRQGRFCLAATHANARRLALAAAQIVAARKAGVIVPSGEPLPEGALSRLTGDAPAEAPRGISLTR